ncbi:hypothetical protein FGW37_09595 [Streptomyces rectiverticillatus]|uniref:hypothetical protein n=1 Tax=Streptomyces rectiverticillatus TaxID=173860 RepID=UPI0015C3FD73|nr:hypothetical protein [Streptomyces rectiverticillatus]QLE71830.1 hypothetical protein FGW37_09595 [Streptomyces rectiverticillatus]
MDAVRVALLREVLAGTEWLQDTRRFAGALRASVARRHGGLLLVGTEAYEPWHLAAHLDDEAAWSGLPELSPTLVRHRVPAGVPAHLSVGLGRLEAARRGETLLVVTADEPGEGLLERVHDARRGGATVLSLDGAPEDAVSEMSALAHDRLAVPAPPAPPASCVSTTTELDLDTVQHLVSAAAGENGLPAPRGGRQRFRDRLARLADQLTAPPPPRW